MVHHNESSNALLAALDGADPLAVTSALRQCVDRLRDQEWAPSLLDALIEKLARLAPHDSPRVRQAVAEAAPYLPDALFGDLVARFKKDASPYVRDAAKRAERRKSTLRREAAKEDEHDQRVDRWYAELGPAKRRVALRIVAHEIEYYVRRMHHEASPLFVPLADTLAKLESAVDKPSLDRGELRGHAARMKELVALLGHVLDESRKRARTVEADFRVENVRALVRGEIERLREAQPERAARIEVDASAVDGSLDIECDANFLKQAFGNILKNAVEAYGNAGPIPIRVSARAAASATQVEIVFEDRGCGMRPESVSEAFVPFGSSKPGGTGFGLFLARRIARQLHGGDLALASTLGQGTTVTMTLPLRQETVKKKRKR